MKNHKRIRKGTEVITKSSSCYVSEHLKTHMRKIHSRPQLSLITCKLPM